MTKTSKPSHANVRLQVEHLSLHYISSHRVPDEVHLSKVCGHIVRNFSRPCLKVTSLPKQALSIPLQGVILFREERSDSKHDSRYHFPLAIIPSKKKAIDDVSRGINSMFVPNRLLFPCQSNDGSVKCGRLQDCMVIAALLD
ncbi:hypothetical protein KIN20_006493 [Parelaphostrongylus tenuis]|uniref:Uncharacterized protein n=1 Tax=Parelaphostrongylus tenuis TaxID=148309 RepID=A0AAD5QGR3_PARTN|nr:hypothetical protein KIN20_006493 [Parelaphostrongylus tenuis]